MTDMMDDTLADESGIPFLSNPDDIPVHSTPIKGDKIPLPSTKNMMKSLMTKQGRFDEYSEAESVQSIRHSDLQPRVRGHVSAVKGQSQSELKRDNHKIREDDGHDPRRNVHKSADKNVQDISNVYNLRRHARGHPVEKAFHYERSRSPGLGQRSGRPEFRRTVDVHIPHSQQTADENEFGISQKSQSDSEKDDRPNSPRKEKVMTVKNGSHAVSKNNNGLQDEDPDLEISIDSTGIGGGSLKVKVLDLREENTDGEHSKRNPDIRIISKIGTERVESKFGAEKKDLAGYDETKDSNFNHRESRNTQQSAERRDTSSERKRVPCNGSRYAANNSFSSNRTLSSSKQNTSFSELENTTLQKQRQEIQLLMAELKDRDRELSDMMSSHQQQLVAWQQDRIRLETLERKCLQYEEELRIKMSQLRSAMSNLKTMKSTESENRKELESFRSSMDLLTKENAELKEELNQLKTRNEGLQGNINVMSKKIGTLEAREQELTTSLRLKEKDISSATAHMKELSERLQQLDLRCKECQDREKEAIKAKQEWKQKFDHMIDEHQVIKGELEHKRKEVVKLAEENKSARQQLALIQKEAGVMEKCKDELIESMRVKQERTDTQLRNLRELYDRQVREVATLQMQLDNSKDVLYKQHISIDDQHGSYQVRLSQASEYSPERSNGSQRPSHHKSSPSHSVKFREPDMTGSHQQTQSSGYQSQLYENLNGNQNVPNSSEKNMINMTGYRQTHRHSNSVNSEDRYMNTTEHISNRSHKSLGSSNVENSKMDKLSSRTDSEINKQPDERFKNSSNEKFKDHRNQDNMNSYGTPPKNQRKLDFDSNRNEHLGERLIISENEDIRDNRYRNTKSYGTPPKNERKLNFDSPQNQKDSDNEKFQDNRNLDNMNSYGTPPRNERKLDFNSPRRQKDSGDEKFHDNRNEDHMNSYRTFPQTQRKLGFDSPHRQDGYILEPVNEGLYHQQIKPESQDKSEVYQLHKVATKTVERTKTMLEDEKMFAFESRVLNQQQKYRQIDDGASYESEHRGDRNCCHHNNNTDGENLTNDGHHNIIRKTENSHGDIDVPAKSADDTADVSHDEDFARRYKFDKKLCSFLEDLDDIDDSIWDEKPVLSANVSTIDSSPASKLRKLLIESQQMIHSLEKSAESSRQSIGPNQLHRKEEESTVNKTPPK